VSTATARREAGAPPADPGDAWDARDRVAALCVALLVLAVYAPSLGHGFVYDDYEVILEQAPLRSPGDLLRVFVEPHGLPSSQLPYYRAVTRATLLLQKTLHGDHAGLFHAVNALLGASAGLLAFALLRLPVFAVPTGLAAAIAALYALHPVTSSVVHPIASGRETLLPALFWMGATWGFLRGGALGRTLAALGFAGALFGKEQAIVLPAVFVIADLLRLAPDPPGWSPTRWVARHAPQLGVLVAYLLVRGVAMPEGDDPAEIPLDPTGPFHTALYALRSFFAPPLRLAYEPPLAVWWSWPAVVVGVLGFAGLVAGACAQGAPARRRLLFWLGYAGASLAITSNILPQETEYDERFVFIALLAPLAVLAGCLAPLWQRAAPRRGLAAGLALLLVVAGATTLRRGEAYRSAVAFGRAWVASNPEHANAHFTLGTALARAGHGARAVEPLQRAVERIPGYGPYHYNLAVVLAGEGRLEEAVVQLEILAAVETWNPEPLSMLAAIRERQGRMAEAARHRDEARKRAQVLQEAQRRARGGAGPDASAAAPAGAASGPAGSP